MPHKITFTAGKAVGALKRALPELLRDAAGFAGAGFIAYGAWLIYEPAGYIVGGTLVLAGVLLSGRVIEPSGVE